jgi:hypothetical protein
VPEWVPRGQLAASNALPYKIGTLNQSSPEGSQLVAGGRSGGSDYRICGRETDAPPKRGPETPASGNMQSILIFSGQMAMDGGTLGASLNANNVDDVTVEV